MMLSKVTRIAAAGICLLGAATEASVIVTLRPRVTSSAGLMTLGEIAEIRATDPADAERVAAVIVGPSPGAGTESRLAYDAVRERLLAAGVDLSTVEFAGATTVLVTAPDAPAASAPPRERVLDHADEIHRAVVDAIRRYLAAQTDVATLDIEVPLSEAQTAFLSAAAVRGCEVVGGAPPWRGEQVFVLRLMDGRERLREVRVTCTLTPRPSVLAAKRALPRGHVVQPDDLVWKKAESEAELACASDPRQILGKETRQPLRTGQAISPEAVRPLPLVRNGQFVNVTSFRPGLNVQRLMRARSDGAAGEIIPLLTLEDHKTVLAKVTGLQEAEVVVQPTAAPADAAVVLGSPSDRPAHIPAVRSTDGAVLPVLHEQVFRRVRAPEPGGYRPRVLANPIHQQSINE
jgi:flagella basal body P-ring formation protein FlgA